MEKAMATHSSTLAWNISWTEEPGRLQSMGSWKVVHGWATSLSLFTFMHWRRKWQPTLVFLLGESQGRQGLGLSSMGSHRVGQQQQQQHVKLGFYTLHLNDFIVCQLYVFEVLLSVSYSGIFSHFLFIEIKTLIGHRFNLLQLYYFILILRDEIPG